LANELTSHSFSLHCGQSERRRRVEEEVGKKAAIPASNHFIEMSFKMSHKVKLFGDETRPARLI
jgi:hypothetical protein